MKRLLAVLLVVLVLTGCSSAPADDNVLVVGMECNYPPFNWEQENGSDYAVKLDSGRYCDGYDVQIARKIADGLGKELKIHVNKAFDMLVSDVTSGTIDLIIGGMTDTPERRQTIDFTDVYYYTDVVIMVRKDSPLASATSLADFSGYKLSAQIGTNHDALIDQISGVNHELALKNFPLLATALSSNAIDGFIAENVVAEAIAISNPGLTYVTFADGKGFQLEDDMSVSVGLAKGNDDLKAKINDILAKLTSEERTEMMNAAITRQP